MTKTVVFSATFYLVGGVAFMSHYLYYGSLWRAIFFGALAANCALTELLTQDIKRVLEVSEIYPSFLTLLQCAVCALALALALSDFILI